MLKKYTSFAFVIAMAQSALSWAQPVMSLQTLAETLPVALQNCPLLLKHRWSEQSAEQLHGFYQALDYAPQWQHPERLQQLSELIEETRYDGLRPAQYRLPEASDIAQQPVCAELLSSHAYLQVLQHLRKGVLDPDKVEPYWYEAASVRALSVSTLAQAVAGLADLTQAFAEARPRSVFYLKLRDTFKQSDLLTQADWGVVEEQGRSLRVGMQDSRVPALRQRLQAAGYLSAEIETASEEAEIIEAEPDGLLYSEALAAAVKSFQQDHYLEDDGIVGPATLRQLNVSPQQRVQQVQVNLERLRWLDKELEPTMLLVDIAGARLLYFRDGDIVWRTRTQVGTLKRQTPLLKSRITHLTINPTWTVPPTIFREDKLPAIRRDLDYLTRSNMTVLDYQGNVLDPASVNWEAPSRILLRQGPGPNNALGLLAIRFANPFSVYLHDTPSQHLFGRAVRNVSSGCVRVEDAHKLLDQLLFEASEQERMRIVQIQESGKTQNVNLPKPVPVLLAYWTVEVDMDNRLRFRSDSYGHDRKVAAALQAAQR